VPEVVCTSCGYIGEPKTITKGNIAIEIVLWLCFLIPGLVYSIWRLSSRYDGCPTCAQGTLIPVTSPMAQRFLRENLPERLVTIEAHQGPSKTAQSVGKLLGRFVGRLLKSEERRG